MRAEFITRKQMRNINDRIERSYGTRLDDTHHYFMRDKDLYRISKDLERIDISKIDEVFAGLYLGEVLDETVRFSIEGSQIIGPNALARVIELDREQWLRWLERSDIEDTRFVHNGFVLVRDERGSFFGSGLVRDGTLRSWVPKGRCVSAH